MTQKSFTSHSLGDYTVTSLYDGFALAPSATLVDTTVGMTFANQLRMWRRTGKFGLRADVLMFLLDTGSEKILIDAGAAKALGPTMGSGTKNLLASGHKAEDVTKVLITHLHPDHACGIMANGHMAYPGATIHVERKDYEFWTAAGNSYRQLLAAFAPYEAAGRLVLFESGAEIAPGISAVPSPGHTVGHSGFRVRSAGESAFFWGDIIHDFDYQLAHPDTTFVLRDYDRSRVAIEIETQQRVLRETSESHELIYSPHAGFPGSGHVISLGDGTYRWESVS